MVEKFREKRQQFDRNSILRGVLLEGRVRGPDGSQEWLSGYTPHYERVIIRQKGMMRNQLIDVKPEVWITDVASGEVSWLGSVE
jgi:hypothetical protein